MPHKNPRPAPPGGFSRSRLRRTLVASATCLSMALGVAAFSPSGAQADPDGSGGLRADGGLAAGDGEQSVVTLITGDRAVVTVADDGTASAFLQGDEPSLTRQDGQELYLVPESAQSAIDSGALDPELFNVAALVRAGYDDDSLDEIPLIVEGKVPVGRGVGTSQRLDSIGATATSVRKDRAATLWSQALRGRSAAGRIWLDAPVEGFGLDPDTGVGQTGAPQVWKKGFTGEGTKVAVLDSGADVDHPDLKDRITLAKDFTNEGDSTDVTDYSGHGTHVASTVAGTGAASQGDRRGMAPAADLLIGRVLGAQGGRESWIISAMEWGVEQRADVVNMSLGTDRPTECNDPVAKSATELSKQNKTLFVVAAGNLGVNEAISSPGCVPGVLTVGAVDSGGTVAQLSSRGPALATHALKPNLTAPGVGIIGAATGSPGGVHYVKMSGTSMASPHVAGAAALLRDAHPGWSAQRLRQALTSGAKVPSQGNVYESGTGELSVPRALSARLLATDAVLIGRFASPHSGKEQKTRRLSFTNTTKKPLEVRFRIRGLRSAHGAVVPRQVMSLGKQKATIKPGRTVLVPVTARDIVKGMPLDAYGGIGGRVEAVLTKGKNKGQVLATGSAGYWLEPSSADLQLEFVDRDGRTATFGQVTLFQLDENKAQAASLSAGPVSTRLTAGRVSIDALVRTDSTGEWSYLSFPEYVLKKDTTLTLDARDAVPIDVQTDQEAQARAATMSYTRVSPDNWVVSQAISPASLREGEIKMSVLPTTDTITAGRASFSNYWRMYDAGSATADSDFVYNLVFHEPNGVRADQTHVIDDADLATVQEDWNALDAADQTYGDVVLSPDPLTGANRLLGNAAEVRAPADRTAYYPAGPRFQSHAMSRAINGELWVAPSRSYGRGQRSTLEWYKMPSATAMPRNPDGSTGRVGERQANLMGVSFEHWKDANGHTAKAAIGDIGGVELRANGGSLGRFGRPSGQWEVPEGETDYQLELNQFSTRLPSNWQLGLATWTTFGFTSQAGPDPDQVNALPIMLPEFDADVDGHNKAPATDDFDLSIDFVGQQGYNPGTVSDVQVEVSYEQWDLNLEKFPSEYEWSDPVPVRQVGGDWVASVDNTPAPGQYVSVHVTGTAQDGSTVDQYAMHVYGVE